MRIAIEGCAHGELEKIYETMQWIENENNFKVDLLICCGDFQATRNLDDLQTMAVPKKYQDMCTFYKYYTGECVAPILTIFVGGNHEASNYLQELPYGGWVASNIYYLGYAGVVRINGIRIAGISGIYKAHDFYRGHHEFSPYTEATKKSVYHVRQLEIFRLKQLSGNIDIFISHDWPHGIYNFGNKAQLIRFKPHFRHEVENDQMGSKPSEDLLQTLKPSFWFAGHMHCKFSAIVHHTNIENCEMNSDIIKQKPFTKFLALDKCLPKRRFLQILDLESPKLPVNNELYFEYDIEWLTILYLTNHLINAKNSNCYMPGPNTGSEFKERYNFTPTKEELLHVKNKFNSLYIPKNFCRTVESYNPITADHTRCQQPKAKINPQTEEFCDSLGIDDPLTLAMLISGHELNYSSNLDNSDATSINSSDILLAEQSNLTSSCYTETSLIKLSPHKRKSSLGSQLPKPITVSFDKSPQESIRKLKLSNPDELSLDDTSNDKNEVGGSKIEINKEENTSEQLKCNEMNSKPPIKKFKRRNQEIYKECSSDNEK